MACAAVLSSAAAAQPASFTDGFETSGLLSTDVPPGRWDSMARDDAKDTIAVSTAAAHGGTQGLRMSNEVGVANSSLALLRFISRTGAQSVRFWYRLSTLDPGSTGYESVIEVGRSSNFFTACQLLVETSGRSWRAMGFDQDNTATIVDLPPGSVDVGRWYRVEVELTGMGTNRGRCRVLVDGVALIDHGQKWDDVTFKAIGLGPENSGATRRAVHDFDDFEALAAPLAAAPDGGVADAGAAGDPPGSPALKVGCGCGASGLLPACWLLGAVMFARRRGRGH